MDIERKPTEPFEHVENTPEHVNIFFEAHRAHHHICCFLPFVRIMDICLGHSESELFSITRLRWSVSLADSDTLVRDGPQDPYSRTSYDISWASDWPIRSLRYIVTCTRIRPWDHPRFFDIILSLHLHYTTRFANSFIQMCRTFLLALYFYASITLQLFCMLSGTSVLLHKLASHLTYTAE